MATLREKTKKLRNIQYLRTKAALLDEVVELIEDKYLAHLMEKTETERSMPLAQAKKLLR